MIGYIILFQVLVTVTQARPQSFAPLFQQTLENDANLDPDFDMNAFRTEQLNLHNEYRALHGVPAMTLDQTLTEQAQAFAEQEAANGGTFEHCNDVPGCDADGAGENLYNASAGSKINPTKSWYSESEYFNYCNAQDGTLTRPGHEGEATGHFTQVVWKDSVHFGIGYAQNAAKTEIFIVARYKDAGNSAGGYNSQVTEPSNIGGIYQNNCNGVNGGFTAWSQPGECSRSCGGGIQLKSRTCTNPKPSLNGADCAGATQQLASQEWCNIESCSGDESHRDQQCEARGHPAQSAIFNNQANQECILYCYSGSGFLYNPAGNVDDGTHCNSGSGACVGGVCEEMLQYVAPTTPPPTTLPPPTNAAGSVTGSYTGTPSPNVLENKFFSVPDGKTNVVITNNDYNAVSIKVGYTHGNSVGYQFGEATWMNNWVDYYGSYETTTTVAGVTFDYKRTSSSSTITIAGPVSPTTGYTLVLFAKGSSSADISWTYDA